MRAFMDWILFLAFLIIAIGYSLWACAISGVFDGAIK